MKQVAERLAAGLKSACAAGRLAGWRLTLTWRRTLRFGLRDDHAGGAVSPPRLSEGLALSYLLVFGEREIARGQYGAAWSLEPEALLTRAESQRHEDADGALLPGPAEIPAVCTADASVDAVVDDDPSPLADAVCAARESAEDAVLSGSADAERRRGLVLSSLGLTAEAKGTAMSYGFSFAGRWGDGETRRQRPPLAEVKSRLDEAARIADLLGETRKAPPAPGEWTVLFHPSAARGLLASFLLGNLEGQTVVLSRGAFPLEDFRTRRQIFRPGFRVAVDPLRDGAVGAYSFSGEGVPAMQSTFVEDGRLVSPVLDMKHAKRAGMEPTGLPLAGDTLQLEDPQAIERDAALRALRPGLLVYTLLGLHTQDPSSGRFSLVAAQALWHEDGQPAGAQPAVLSGRLLDGFGNGSLQLVAWPGEHWPGLLMRCDARPRANGA